jgi:hypothetical protein
VRNLQKMLSKTWHSAALCEGQSVCNFFQDLGLRCHRAAPLRLKRGQFYDVPSTALLDFCDVELEEVVKPRDEFLSIWTAASVHVAGPEVNAWERRLWRWGKSHLDSPMMCSCSLTNREGVRGIDVGRRDALELRVVWRGNTGRRNVVVFVDGVCVVLERRVKSFLAHY